MPQPDLEVFIAPDDAFAAFEAAVLAASTRVLASFRSFDMRMPLISDAARAVGETWFDLLLDAVQRGVRVDLVVSDFDPVMATDLHRQAWATVKQGAALAELAGQGAAVRVRAALHPARPGALPRLAFALPVLQRLRRARAALSEAALSEAPGLRTQVPALHPVTHHQKLAVIDHDTLYIGGLDLNPRRYDTAAHDRAARDTWSDVQVMLRDHPAVAEAAAHIDSFEEVVAGRRAPDRTTHLVRTISANRALRLPFLSPQTLVAEVDAAHRAAFAAARHLIHLETQFMRSRPLAELLARAGRACPMLSLVLVLPALPEDAAFAASEDAIGIETRYGLDLEREALEIVRDGFGDRATIATPVQPVTAARDGLDTHAGSPLIYVHNKVLVQDDALALVGSGNLNGRSLRWDTEAGLRIDRPDWVARLRGALHRHWWRDDDAPGWRDPATQAQAWQAEIRRNDARRPEAQRGFLVSHDTAVHARVGHPLPLVTDDIV